MEKKMVPNLFIPGAARCGSTSLYAILRQHPDIHTSIPKEPTYFNWPFQVIANPFEYFQLFASPKRYRLDASVNYLANPQTPALLQSLFPDARFIIILREPKARAYSLYNLMRHIEGEKISDFASALKAEPCRFTSHEFFSSCRFEFWNYMYIRSSTYDEQIARYLDVYDRKQFHILTLAELTKDPMLATTRVLHFLDLDPTPVAAFNYAARAVAPVNRESLYDAESEEIMSRAFDGLIERTDRIVGSALDWSL